MTFRPWPWASSEHRPFDFYHSWQRSRPSLPSNFWSFSNSLNMMGEEPVIEEGEEEEMNDGDKEGENTWNFNILGQNASHNVTRIANSKIKAKWCRHSQHQVCARAAEKFNPADFFAVIAHLWSFSALVSLRRCRKGWRNKRGSQGEEVKDLIIVVLISTINCILPDMTSFSSSNTFYFQTYMPKDLKAGEELVPDMSAYEMLYHVS